MITDPQRSVEERVARHLAARDWLTDDDRWVDSTAAFRADYLTAAREVIAIAREGEPAVPAVVLPPAPRADEEQPVDRAALRDHIAEAFARYDWNVAPVFRSVTPNADHYGLADAVLAVLPAPGDRDSALNDTERQFLTFALDLAADEMASRGDEFNSDDEDALEKLRRMADETQQRPASPPARPRGGV